MSADLLAAARELDRLSLIILSAVNLSDRPNLPVVAEAIRANRAAIKKAIGAK